MGDVLVNAKVGVGDMAGSDESRLIIVRGNSGSGKSSLARAVRRIKPREVAIVGQDVLRRQVLHVRDEPENAAIGLIDLTARYALAQGFHVVVEGILTASLYGSMLRKLASDHEGRSFSYRYDLTFDETLRRHLTKDISDRFGATEMRQWWVEQDTLSGIDETVFDAEVSLCDATRRIAGDCRWL